MRRGHSNLRSPDIVLFPALMGIKVYFLLKVSRQFWMYLFFNLCPSSHTRSPGLEGANKEACFLSTSYEVIRTGQIWLFVKSTSLDFAWKMIKKNMNLNNLVYLYLRGWSSTTDNQGIKTLRTQPLFDLMKLMQNQSLQNWKTKWPIQYHLICPVIN